MILNSYADGSSAQVLSLNDALGWAYLTGGSGTTRIISLNNHPLRDELTADNFYVSFGGAFTYSGNGSGVTGINYTYDTENHVLTVSFDAARLHPTEFAFDRDNWKLIVVR